jgi:hypothetical protein
MSILKRYNSNARHYAVFVGYAAGELSEGQSCKMLGMDRIDFREAYQEYLEVCRELWREHKETKRTVADLRRDEAATQYDYRPCLD